jgi:hypothetical protein
MTLSAPAKRLDKPAVLQLEGRAVIDGATVSRTAVPAEDMMQAFLWRHLVPCQELMAAVTSPGRQSGSVQLAMGAPVRMSNGASTRIRVKTPDSPLLPDVRLELSDPPEGVRVRDVKAVFKGLEFVLEVDGDTPQPGFEDNLIVQAFLERTIGGQGTGKPERTQRSYIGVLPAIPLEIVQ